MKIRLITDSTQRASLSLLRYLVPLTREPLVKHKKEVFSIITKKVTSQKGKERVAAGSFHLQFLPVIRRTTQEWRNSPYSLKIQHLIWDIKEQRRLEFPQSFISSQILAARSNLSRLISQKQSLLLQGICQRNIGSFFKQQFKKVEEKNKSSHGSSNISLRTSLLKSWLRSVRQLKHANENGSKNYSKN